MNLRDATRVRDRLHELDIKCDLTESYSGRGMFGRTTAALIVEDMGVVTTTMKFLGMDPDELRRDNMGFDYVIY